MHAPTALDQRPSTADETSASPMYLHVVIADPPDGQGPEQVIVCADETVARDWVDGYGRSGWQIGPTPWSDVGRGEHAADELTSELPPTRPHGSTLTVRATAGPVATVGPESPHR